MTRAERQEAYGQLLRDRFGLEDEEFPKDGPLIRPEQHVELARALKEQGYTLYVFCVASHWLETTPKKGDPVPEHYEVATGLRTVGAETHLARWRVEIPIGATIDTLVPLYAGADWQEREQYDLVGVVFARHPDLRRLMMPEEWVGHPLRKDYAIDTGHAPWR